MSYLIEYYAVDGKHISLKSDGTIELYRQITSDLDKPICLDYEQSRELKRMIIAEYKLENNIKQ